MNPLQARIANDIADYAELLIRKSKRLPRQPNKRRESDDGYQA